MQYDAGECMRWIKCNGEKWQASCLSGHRGDVVSKSSCNFLASIQGDSLKNPIPVCISLVFCFGDC